MGYSRTRTKVRGAETTNLPSYIRTVAKLRNISAAAEELGISQPALSARIKKLEDQLGASVFDRSKSPLAITEAGKAYLVCQDKIEVARRELAVELSSISDMKAGLLTIGGASFFNITYFLNAVAEFARRYPGIDIEIVDDTVPNLTAKALEGKLDLFITPFALDSSGLEYEEFLTERIFICLPPQSPIAQELSGLDRKKGVLEVKGTQEDAVEFTILNDDDFKAFEDSTFITLGEDQQIGQKMVELLEHCGLVPKKTVRVSQTLTGLGLTMADVGISLVTETTLKSVNFKELPALFLADERICARDLYIVHSKGPGSGAMQEFIRLLRETNNL